MVGQVDKFWDGATTIILGQGLAGVVMVCLCYAFYRVCKLYIAAQEARIRESGVTTSALQSSTTVLTRVADILAQRKN